MEKKTDRRTLYTIGAVKDAFLTLIRTTPYDRISVTAICRQAEISRATFYLHFNNLDDVLEQVIDDALLISEGGCGSLIDMLNFFADYVPGEPEALEKCEEHLPACQRIADSERYHALFMDSLLSEHIIRRMAMHERDRIIPELIRRGGLTEEQAEMIFKFALNGTFAINRSMGWKKDARWFETQYLLCRFIDGGIQSICSKGDKQP